MKFIGENTLRLTRETVMRALVESFDKTYIGGALTGVKMTYHSNGDISLTVKPVGGIEAVLKKEAAAKQAPASEPGAQIDSARK